LWGDILFLSCPSVCLLHMVSLLSTKFHEILFSSFRGVALTNCVTDRRTDRQTDGQDKNNMSPHKSGGRHNSSITQFVSATPLKLLNRISWNLVDSKDTICSCAYYQEILIAWILWELCPFELRIRGCLTFFFVYILFILVSGPVFHVWICLYVEGMFLPVNWSVSRLNTVVYNKKICSGWWTNVFIF
jgi:hypothetical protein